MDGNLTPVGTFNMTSGSGDDTGQLPTGTTTNYMQIGNNFTPLNGSFDLDFYSIRFGAVAPSDVPEPSVVGVLAGAAIAMMGRRRRA